MHSLSPSRSEGLGRSTRQDFNSRIKEKTVNNSTAIRIQHADLRDMIFKKNLKDFQEIYGDELGREAAKKYSEYSARLYLLHEHQKIEKQRRKAHRA